MRSAVSRVVRAKRSSERSDHPSVPSSPIIYDRPLVQPLAEFEKRCAADDNPDPEEAKQPFPARLHACRCNIHQGSYEWKKDRHEDIREHIGGDVLKPVAEARLRPPRPSSQSHIVRRSSERSGRPSVFSENRGRWFPNGSCCQTTVHSQLPPKSEAFLTGTLEHTCNMNAALSSASFVLIGQCTDFLKHGIRSSLGFFTQMYTDEKPSPMHADDYPWTGDLHCDRPSMQSTSQR
jgi:hypothetical protein